MKSIKKLREELEAEEREERELQGLPPAIPATEMRGAPELHKKVKDAPAPEPKTEREQEERVVVPPPAPLFDTKAFAEAIGFAIAANIPAIAKIMRESNIDPEKERIKAMRRQQQREDQAAARKADVDKWLRCDHMRTHPYSGTARIGWATQSDGVTRGVCMGCGCPFTPIAQELPDPVRLAHLYDKYKNIPVSIARNDFLQGMVVAGNPA